MANFNAVLYCRWSMASHTGFSFLSDIPDLVAISTQLGIPLQCPPVNHKRCNVQDTKNHIPHAKYKRKQSTKGVKMQHSKLYSTSHQPLQISDCPETLIPQNTGNAYCKPPLPNSDHPSIYPHSQFQQSTTELPCHEFA